MQLVRNMISLVRRGGPVAAMSAMLVLFAIVTLPGCPRIPSAMAASQDLRTVTEDRSVVERFSAPGHYLLHGITGANLVCEACDQADAAADQQAAPATVLTIDATQRDEPATWQAANAMHAARLVGGSERVPADHVAPVPAPPPRSA